MSTTKDDLDSKSLKPYSFRFADGMVEDSLSENLEFDHMVCRVSPLIRPDFDFRGFISVCYPGDGHSASFWAATVETFGSRAEAIAAMKALAPLALTKWEPDQSRRVEYIVDGPFIC